MATAQADIGRHTKVIIAGASVCGVAVAYLVYSYSVPASNARSAIGAMSNGRGESVAESPHYGAVLEKYNRQNAAAASQKGETYLSVFSARPQAVAAPSDTLPSNQVETPAPTAAPAPAPVPAPSPDSRSADAQEDARRRQQAAEQAAGLMSNWTAVAHSVARIGEAPPALLAAKDEAARHEPEATPRSEASKAGQLLVPGFTLVPATLRTDIDTDENSTVEAQIPAGAYAGATVYALGYKRQNNSVDMTFSHMTWNGRTYRINAKPVDQLTMRSVLSGDVNNRYISRILVPALALGLGRAGQLFEQADTQTVIGPFGNVIQVRDGRPSGRTVAGAVAGGVATEAGQVLRNDAAQLPVKQVLIARDQTIGVRFIEPVFDTNEVTAGADSLAAATAQQPAQVSAQDAAGSPLPAATGRR